MPRTKESGGLSSTNETQALWESVCPAPTLSLSSALCFDFTLTSHLLMVNVIS